MSSWSNKDVIKSQEILRKYTKDRFHQALKEISRTLKRSVTPGALRSAFLRKEVGPPTSYCQQDDYDGDDESVAFKPPVDLDGEDEGARRKTKDDGGDELMKKLVSLTKKPIPFEMLCDKMGLPPGKVKALVTSAKDMGVRLRVEHDHVGIQPSEPEDRVRSIGIAPVVGERQRVAVISDLHLGSKYCLRDQLKEFIQYAYDQGIREILCPGDVLDGGYRHGIFEVSHTGIDAQAQDLFETLPHLPGLNYRCITGNHDFTFTESIGVDVGDYLESYFSKRGRSDLHFYGNRGAFLKVKGAIVHLWHPRSGVSYARSYAIQKHIEKYSSGEKPNILLCGHWHVYCHVYERGVHGIACPTFQGGGSAFGKSLGGAPAIGGMILSWDLTEHGTMRHFIHEYRAYFEVEKPHTIDDDTAYLEEMPVDRKRR
jgi:hypothetical protein